MLLHLSIENYALIQKLELDFYEGFSVITGETGAGKSILLGALSLILGKRADSQILLDKSKKCIIEGTFKIKDYGLNDFFQKNQLDYDDISILRREINKNGKSRAFINDTPVNLNILKELGDKLVDIHSQNKTITLNDSDFQLAVIDNYAGHSDIIKKYKSEYSNFINLDAQLSKLIEKEDKYQADKDYYKFLFDELNKAELKQGEQEELEKKLEILNNAEKIKTNLFKASYYLNSSDNNLLTQLVEVNSLISEISNYYPEIKEINDRLDSNIIDIKDISNDIERIEQKLVYDSKQVEKLNDRLDVIYHLQQKHRVSSIDDLIKIKNSLSDKLNNISSLKENINKLKLEISDKKLILSELANSISKNRKKSIPQIEKELLKIFSNLAMQNAQFKVEQTQLSNFTKDGIDRVRFLFNANRGGEKREISKIASGGELSRLMLSIKSLISQKNLLPTIIFDEIDMGVSGDIAAKVGDIMKKMSSSMQVIAITHLPQIAGKGDTHYLAFKVFEKNHTKSIIKKLNEKERINEIAKMLSSSKISSAAHQTAKELLEITD